LAQRKTTENRRQEILLGSLDIFTTKGYYGTSTRNISKEIGISSGLMFHYFESKEKLYTALLQEALKGIGIIEKIPESLSPLQIFEGITKTLLDIFSRSSETIKMFLLVKQAEQGDFLTDEMKEIMKHMDTVTKMIPIIEEGQRKGEIKLGNPYALSRCFFSCIQGVAETIACYPDIPLPKASWIIDILRRNQ